MMHVERIQNIEKLLTEALSPISLDIADESDQHIGHPGNLSGAGHFAVRIVSERFNEKSRIARHQLVYEALSGMMGAEIHALRIEAKSPEEV